MAELYVYPDPDAAMGKVRRFSETLAKLLIQRAGLNPKKVKNQSGRIEALAQAGAIPQHVRQLFHEVRMAGNEAVHHYTGDRQKASAAVAAIFQLGAWWYETETGKTVTHVFTPPPRTTFPSSQKALKSIEDQLAQLQATFDRSMQPKAVRHTVLPVAGGVVLGGVLLVFVLAVIVSVCCVLGSLMPNGSDRPNSMTSSAPWSTAAASSSPVPIGSGGVTYECTGSAPGIDITYGPSGSNIQATRLPFSEHESIKTSASFYHLRAQLQGSGHVTCTLTVTYAGCTITEGGTARGGYNIASALISDSRWESCD